MFLILTNVTSLQINYACLFYDASKQVNVSLSVSILFKSISDESFNLRTKLWKLVYAQHCLNGQESEAGCPQSLE